MTGHPRCPAVGGAPSNARFAATMPRDDDVKIGSQPSRSQAHILLLVVMKSFHFGLSSKGAVGERSACEKPMRVWRVLRRALFGELYVGISIVGSDMARCNEHGSWWDGVGRAGGMVRADRKRTRLRETR